MWAESFVPSLSQALKADPRRVESTPFISPLTGSSLLCCLLPWVTQGWEVKWLRLVVSQSWGWWNGRIYGYASTHLNCEEVEAGTSIFKEWQVRIMVTGLQPEYMTTEWMKEGVQDAKLSQQDRQEVRSSYRRGWQVWRNFLGWFQIRVILLKNCLWPTVRIPFMGCHAVALCVCLSSL